MSAPDPDRPAPFARLDGQPAFDEPWQAQVLAIADTLIVEGRVAPKDWSAALGTALDRAARNSAPDTVDTYYLAALAALEAVLLGGDHLDGQEIARRRDAWKQAYLETPHGKPVELRR